MRDLLDFWFLDCLDCGLDLILDCGKVFGKVFGRLFEKVLFENICCVLLFFTFCKIYCAINAFISIFRLENSTILP